MSSRKNGRLHVLLVLLLFMGGLAAARALGASGQNGYPPGTTSIVALGYYADQQESQPRRGPLTVADTTTLTQVNLSTFTVANGGRIKVLGRPNLPLSVRFTDSGAAVSVCYVAIWNNPAAPTVDHVLGISPITTVTATIVTDAQGRYIAETLVSDGYGSSDGIWLLVGNPTSGSVYLDPGSY